MRKLITRITQILRSPANTGIKSINVLNSHERGLSNTEFEFRISAHNCQIEQI